MSENKFPDECAVNNYEGCFACMNHEKCLAECQIAEEEWLSEQQYLASEEGC